MTINSWVDYLCLSSFTDLFVKFFVCTRLTALSWLFVFIVIYRSFVKFFVCTRLTALSWLFVLIVIYQPFCQVFRMYQTYCGLSWLFVFIVIYQPFCQVFRMYQTYCVELAICVYRHLPTFLSSFSYVPDLLGWGGYLCLSSFTDLFVKFFVCTRLTVLSWLFVLIVIYQPFCQVFRMYQTYCVELTICVYRYLPTFLSSFSYVPDLLYWVDYLCLSSFTDLFVKFFVCTRFTVLSWLFVFIVIYRSFCQVFRMYQTYCWVDYLCLSSFTDLFVKFSYVPDLLRWVGYLCLSSNSQLNPVSLVHTKNLTKRSVNDDKHK